MTLIIMLFSNLINVKKMALIVILDEIDFLRSDNVLYIFSRAIANEKLKDGRFISVIGLSNSIKFEKTLDPRVLSSMGFKKFQFSLRFWRSYTSYS